MDGVSSSAVAPGEPGPRRTALYALLALIVGVAIALVVQSALAYRRANEVEGMLGRAQAEALLRAITPSLRHRDDSAALARLLDDHRGDGLRYVAVIGRGGGVRAEAGVSVEPATVASSFAAPGNPGRRIGGRWRVYSPLPPHLRGPPGAGDVGPPDGFDRPPGPPPGVPPPMVIEVEPSIGPALRREATRTLIVGLASALVLLGVAIVLARWVRHRERLEARIAHDRRLAALGEMSAVLAHEIRNPLASLKGHAQLLVESLPADDRDHAKAVRVVDEAIRLERLTNDLLEFARTGRIERTPCDPRTVLTSAAATLDGERITVTTDGAPAMWSLDAGRMNQVLGNLLGNALDAAPSTPVTASVTHEAGRLIYRIRDRGPGLPGDVARMFEPFHTTRVNGVGLGLTVARRLVELHGGTLEGRNHPDGGAELTVSIPAGSAGAA